MSNETILIGILALGIGALAATFLVLTYDVRSWERRLKKTEDQRDAADFTTQTTQKDLQKSEKQLVEAQKEIENLTQKLEHKDEAISKLDTEKIVLQSELDTARQEIENLNEQIGQLNGHVSDLRDEAQKLQSDLQAATEQNLLLKENLERYNTQLEASRKENQDVCQKLAVSEVELSHLQKDLEEAKSLEDRAELLQNEKDVLEESLDAAQQQIKVLKVQLKGTLQKVTKAKLLKERLFEAEADRKSATTQVDTLQQKLSSVKGTLDYTGKGQLQIIRGIGPTYAKRLKEAGIHTLNDLAKSTPEQVKNAIQARPWQNVNIEVWVQEAKALTIKLGEEDEMP